MPLHLHPEIITDRRNLALLVGRLEGESLIAFDLEADSLHHYTEKVCLIQISTSSESVLIDPLAFSGLDTLAVIMADAAIRKVFHGADYDIRSLHRDFAVDVQNLFDTMIASQFLGEKEFGLAAVLKKRFGVDLDKKYQKADWSKRPLEKGMISYAVTDTSLLIDLYLQLEQELRKLGRLSWVEEECAILSRVRVADREKDPLFLRFKSSSRMDPLTLQVLEGLLNFRDEKARLRDIPPFKIMQNELIRELAERKPQTTYDLEQVPGFSPKLADRFGRELVAIISKSCAVPESRLPRYPRQFRPKRTPLQEENLKLLKQWREKKAMTLGLDAGILANNALLEMLVDIMPKNTDDLEKVPAMRNWQRLQFGAEIVALIA